MYLESHAFDNNHTNYHDTRWCEWWKHNCEISPINLFSRNSSDPTPIDLLATRFKSTQTPPHTPFESLHSQSFSLFTIIFPSKQQNHPSLFGGFLLSFRPQVVSDTWNSRKIYQNLYRNSVPTNWSIYNSDRTDNYPTQDILLLYSVSLQAAYSCKVFEHPLKP